METLKEKAEAILKAEEDRKALLEEEERQKIIGIKQKLLSEFEIGFKDFLDLIKMEGINYKAQMQDDRYAHFGTYIEFFRGDKSVKMDFNSRNSYRYEFVKHNNDGRYGTMVYGEWSKDKFLVFLYRSLY